MEVLYYILVLGIYLLPSLVADHRKHNNRYAIYALNILLGWIVIGWIASIIWALTDNTGNHGRQTK